MQKTINFKSGSGVNLVGILNNPKECIEDTPLMILCHGFTSNKESSTYLDLEKGLAEKGIASFRFDFFGHGDSDGYLGDITLSETVDGAHQAFLLMKELGFTKIGFFGCSYGGCTVLNLVSELNNEVACLVCKAPVSDYAKQKRRKLGEEGIKERKEEGSMVYKDSEEAEDHYDLKYKFYEDMNKNNVHEKAHKIKIPALIVHGTDDTAVLLSQSEKTAELIDYCRLEVIEGGDHGLRNTGEGERVNQLFVDFAAEHLLS